MENTKNIKGKITKIGEVRANSTGTGYNFFLMIEGLGNGVYFFGTQDELTTLSKTVDTTHMYELEYTEDTKGIKGQKIEQIPEETQSTMTEPPTPPEPTAKVIYCRWNNTNKKLTHPEMAQYTKDFIIYSSELYKNINETVQDTHMCDRIFDKMCQPFQYFIEDSIRAKEA